MAEVFQALLDRINEQGIKKAEENSSKLLSDAKAEAERIIADAKSQAADIIREAEKSAAILQQKGEQSLKQASRAVLLDLRSTLEKRVADAASALVKETLNAKDLAGVIASICQGFVASNGTQDNLRILLNDREFAALESAIKAKLGADLQAKVEFAPSDKLRGGFKLAFKGSDVMYDFSDAALAEAIAQHLSANIAKVIAE